MVLWCVSLCQEQWPSCEVQHHLVGCMLRSQRPEQLKLWRVLLCAQHHLQSRGQALPRPASGHHQSEQLPEQLLTDSSF